MRRRSFLSAALIGLSRKAPAALTGGFVNDDFTRGHQLRDRRQFAAPRETVKTAVAIVGGGIAGLCAGWRLAKTGLHDFVVLEMEARPGGNSRSGRNQVSAYPWGAHYLPVPAPQSVLVRELCADLGLLADGAWNERSLCFSPQERLFIHGEWQEDLEPRFDHAEMQRFAQQMQEFRHTGEFTIPMALGARPSPLDSITFAEWLRKERFTSSYLLWYADYACRDDYGARAGDTSAWAGIHYFASREPEDKGPLTWPEGNGWLVARLLERVGAHVRTDAMAHRIAREGTRWRVSASNIDVIADAVVFAAPTFLAPYIIDPPPAIPHREYSPWLTANLTIERPPREHGFERAWDNVIFDSPALGYVVATHQSLRTHEERSVWTYYWSLADGTPGENRKALLTRDWAWWRDAIFHDLEKAHPDIRECCSRMDIARFGHAMARPVPGFLLAGAPNLERLYFANSDVSGFSIFEEAQCRGVAAANQALRVISGRR